MAHVTDRACVQEGPVDCIDQGGRSRYLQPDECIDRGADEPVGSPGVAAKLGRLGVDTRLVAGLRRERV